jgi:tRNA-Thr(GGU) m(6)t(6)A37 methyltransferase TsaA
MNKKLATEKTIRPVAVVESDFPEKFGIPRQSGIAKTISHIRFLPEFQNPDAVRALESFSYIWLIFGFSENETRGWHPTVRPPRLGGNTRVGVFASRSPFRPNGLGLSSVRLLRVDTESAGGPVLTVEGADLMDGTPIYDIKPYLPDFDLHEDARGGYTASVAWNRLRVSISDDLLSRIPEEKREGLLDILAEDPRPSYQNDPERIYGLSYAGFCVRFTVRDPVLTVLEIRPE